MPKHKRRCGQLGMPLGYAWVRHPGGHGVTFIVPAVTGERYAIAFTDVDDVPGLIAKFVREIASPSAPP